MKERCRYPKSGFPSRLRVNHVVLQSKQSAERKCKTYSGCRRFAAPAPAKATPESPRRNKLIQSRGENRKLHECFGPRKPILYPRRFAVIPRSAAERALPIPDRKGLDTRRPRHRRSTNPTKLES